ncbi:protein ACCELERATED CELL DEATH 6-like isoform X1 [Panicum miliaceum]|uniref:Protein ACCELERATED CELL DEATH 6-like isoform X1 n=1 Tax=Panicum miliaceum TaxID=4540 RepID=A0A3L6Q3Y0_PANMI|nr:protein ACCELERATED CELL DEATH 6-like isoform X1 [Panicum miliaceum]
MDRGLLHAAKSGDAGQLKQLAMDNPSVLLGTTPQGNNCLHISSIHGHEKFCKDAVELHPSFLAAVNVDGETPLLTALTSGHPSLASFFLACCSAQRLREAILRQDKNGYNALHHAIRSGNTDLALELIAAEPDLSHAVNKSNESPMFIAVLRGFTDVFVELLNVPNSADAGACSYNALHAAVKNGNSVIAKMIVKKRPWLARQETNKRSSPMNLAVIWDKVEVLRVLLEHDWSLGHVISSEGCTLLHSAAYQGHVSVARMLIDHCPDAPYSDAVGWTCLHEAVCHGRMDFVEFVLESPQLRKLVNMRDANGRTALHHAVQRCNPKIVTALLLNKDIDFTIMGNNSRAAIWELYHAIDHAKTLNWLNSHASILGPPLPIAVELDVGSRRTNARPKQAGQERQWQWGAAAMQPREMRHAAAMLRKDGKGGKRMTERRESCG